MLFLILYPMKKLFLAALAILCVCSCRKDEQDVIYTISLGISSYSVGGPIPSDGRDILDEFSAAVSDFKTRHSSDFVWTEKVADSKYSVNDSDAKSKFDTYYKELKTIETTYQSKFDSCKDDLTMVKVVYVLKLDRTASADAVLAEETITVTLGE